MNIGKRKQRLEILLNRLQEDGEVSNRDLRLVLDESDYETMRANWDAERSSRYCIKPKAIKRYEAMLHQATFAEIKHQQYLGLRKAKQKGDIAIKLANDVEHILEKALDHANDIGGINQPYAHWFDRPVRPNINLSLEDMPRISTSKSFYGNNGSPNPEAGLGLTIRDIKIIAIKNALIKIDDPEAFVDIDPIGEAKKALDQVKGFNGRKLDLSKIKF